MLLISGYEGNIDANCSRNESHKDVNNTPNIEEDVDQSSSNSDDGSDWSDWEFDESNTLNDEEMDEFEEITKEELLACDFLTNFQYNFDMDDVFSTSDIQRYKEKERGFMEKFHIRYYRCKVKYQTLYNQLNEALEPYLTEDMSKILHHGWSTQINETMNNSVASYAPKNRHYSIQNHSKRVLLL